MPDDVGLDISVKTPDKTALDYAQSAYDALQAGQMESAIAYYKKVLELEPKNKDALFGLATTYHRGGQTEEARAAYMRLISMDREHWEAMNNFFAVA